MKKVLLLAALFLLLLTGLAQANSGLWDASVVYMDNNVATMQWDAPKDGTGMVLACPAGLICFFEIEMRGLEDTTFVQKYVVPNWTTLTYDIQYKKSGHFQFFIRTCEKATEDSTPDCSDWADSIHNGAVVVGVPAPIENKGWILYWRIPPPGGGGIE